MERFPPHLLNRLSVIGALVLVLGAAYPLCSAQSAFHVYDFSTRSTCLLLQFTRQMISVSYFPVFGHNHCCSRFGLFLFTHGTSRIISLLLVQAGRLFLFHIQLQMLVGPFVTTCYFHVFFKDYALYCKLCVAEEV